METAHHSIRGLAFIVLDKGYIGNLLSESTLRKRLHEIPAAITEHIRFDDKHSLYVCLQDLHQIIYFYKDKHFFLS